MTKQLATETAAQLVIMDAIEKGATKNDIIKFMGTLAFEAAVKRYVEMLQAEFN